MPPITPRFAEFPSGRWWIKWIDWASAGGGAPGQAVINVFLQKLPDDVNTEESAWVALKAAKTAERKCVRLSARYLPALAAGAIFRDGVPDGRLRMISRSLAVDLPGEISDMACSGSLAKPSWWSPPVAPVVLNSRLGFPEDGRCSVIESPDHAVVIPAFVVVGALLARSGALVRAIVEQPWPIGLKALVTAFSSDQTTRSGRIELADGVKSDDALSVAALLPGLNDAGFQAASAVHASIMANGRLGGWLPYGEGKHLLRVAGAEVYPGKFLVMRIEEGPWPGPLRLEIIELGKFVEDLDDPADSFKKEMIDVVAGELEAIDAISDDNPADDRMVGTTLSEATGWAAMPSVETSKGPPRTRAGKVAIPSSAGSAERISTGDAPGGRYVGKTDAIQTLMFGSSIRFELIAEAFDDLLAEKKIAGWSVLRPRKAGQLRGQRFVWSLPGREKSRWPLIDAEKGVPRTAMVAEITRIDRVRVYWIEIETDGGNVGFKALAFTARTTPVEDVVARLLEQASSTRGVWGDPAKLQNAFRLEYTASFRHGTCNNGSLNAGRIQQVIEDLIDKA